MTEHDQNPVQVTDLPIGHGVVEHAVKALNSWDVTPEKVAELLSEDLVLSLIVLTESNSHTPKCLRDSFASQLLSAGVSLERT